MQEERPEDVDAVTDELHRFVSLVLRSIQGDAFRRIAELELSLTHMRMLFVLDAAQRDWPLNELARGIGLSDAATSRAVDALWRARLVTRREDPDDRRVKRIALAEAGRETVQRIAAARRDALHRLVADLGDDERAALAWALAPVLARLDERSCEPREASR